MRKLLSQRTDPTALDSQGLACIGFRRKKSLYFGILFGQPRHGCLDSQFMMFGFLRCSGGIRSKFFGPQAFIQAWLRASPRMAVRGTFCNPEQKLRGTGHVFTLRHCSRECAGFLVWVFPHHPSMLEIAD